MLLIFVKETTFIAQWTTRNAMGGVGRLRKKEYYEYSDNTTGSVRKSFR
jgi:hypothetical protein